MNRRRTWCAAAVTLIVIAGPAASATAAQRVTTPSQPVVQPAATSDPDAEAALRRLRADADGAVSVHRDAQGDVDFVRSTDGSSMVDARGTTTPARTATDQLARYGDAFGIDGDTSRAVVEQTLPSATGGSVVRAEQVVDGVPVFGGQVVMSLDENHGVVSVDAATTGATQVPGVEVSEAEAEQVALRMTAKTHHVAAGTLSAVRKGRVLYDPAIVHTVDPLGTRPAWQFEVGNGNDIRETVLIGIVARRGGTALQRRPRAQPADLRQQQRAHAKQ